MAEASRIGSSDLIAKTLGAAAVVNEVQQGPDGRASYLDGFAAAAINTSQDFRYSGQVVLPKLTTFAGIDGNRAFWSHADNKVTYRRVSSRDFAIGTFVGESAAADTACTVALNVSPHTIPLVGGGFNTVAVGSATISLVGGLTLELTSANEAQKTDALSIWPLATISNPIVTGTFRVVDGSSGTNPDFNIGLASATHATDADSIAQHVFFHIDGNAVDIFAQSKDSSTTVAAVDTTINYTAGTSISEQVHFCIDARDPASVKLYLNGARVLSGSTFRLDNAAGPLYLIAHLEKTSSTDSFKIVIDSLEVRTQD